MSRVPLAVYFAVVIGALLVAGTPVLSWAAFFAIAATGAMCLVLLHGVQRAPRADTDITAAALPPPDNPADYIDHGVRVPHHILDYLWSNHVRFRRRGHARAVSANELARSLHVPTTSVAKPVLVRADGDVWMAVLPAAERVDFHALRDTLRARTIEMLPESEMRALFPDCELGAEPPFGHLYHVPMIVEMDLTRASSLVVRGGCHHQAIELPYEEFERLEEPLVAHFTEPMN